VSIKAGEAGKEFRVHKNLICDQSPYFERAFNGGFTEGQSGQVVLQDTQEYALRIVLTWLYTGRLEYVPAAEGSDLPTALTLSDHERYAARGATTTEEEEERLNEECAKQKNNDPKTWLWSILLDLYIFGDRYDMIRLRRTLIDIAIAKDAISSITPSNNTIRCAFANLASNSPMRQFLIDHCAFNRIIHDSDDDRTLPTEFLCGMLRRLTCRNPSKLCKSCHKIARYQVPKISTHLKAVMAYSKGEDIAPYHVDACIYHEHADDAERHDCSASKQPTPDSP